MSRDRKVLMCISGMVIYLIVLFWAVSWKQQITAQQYGLVAEWSKQYPEIRIAAKECFHYDQFITPECFHKIENIYKVFKIEEIINRE